MCTCVCIHACVYICVWGGGEAGFNVFMCVRACAYMHALTCLSVCLGLFAFMPPFLPCLQGLQAWAHSTFEPMWRLVRGGEGGGVGDAACDEFDVLSLEDLADTPPRAQREQSTLGWMTGIAWQVWGRAWGS